jgi:hypothetical protein
MLAAELRADQLIVDDREGRRLAEDRGITVIGTLGVLKEAATLGLLDLRACVARLQTALMPRPQSRHPRSHVSAIFLIFCAEHFSQRGLFIHPYE